MGDPINAHHTHLKNHAERNAQTSNSSSGGSLVTDNETASDTTNTSTPTTYFSSTPEIPAFRLEGGVGYQGNLFNHEGLRIDINPSYQFRNFGPVRVRLGAAVRLLDTMAHNDSRWGGFMLGVMGQGALRLVSHGIFNLNADVSLVVGGIHHQSSATSEVNTPGVETGYSGGSNFDPDNTPTRFQAGNRPQSGNGPFLEGSLGIEGSIHPAESDFQVGLRITGGFVAASASTTPEGAPDWRHSSNISSVGGFIGGSIVGVYGETPVETPAAPTVSDTDVDISMISRDNISLLIPESLIPPEANQYNLIRRGGSAVNHHLPVRHTDLAIPLSNLTDVTSIEFLDHSDHLLKTFRIPAGFISHALEPLPLRSRVDGRNFIITPQHNTFLQGAATSVANIQVDQVPTTVHVRIDNTLPTDLTISAQGAAVSLTSIDALNHLTEGPHTLTVITLEGRSFTEIPFTVGPPVTPAPQLLPTLSILNDTTRAAARTLRRDALIVRVTNPNISGNVRVVIGNYSNSLAIDSRTGAISIPTPDVVAANGNAPSFQLRAMTVQAIDGAGQPAAGQLGGPTAVRVPTPPIVFRPVRSAVAPRPHGIVVPSSH